MNFNANQNGMVGLVGGCAAVFAAFALIAVSFLNALWPAPAASAQAQNPSTQEVVCLGKPCQEPCPAGTEHC